MNASIRKLKLKLGRQLIVVLEILLVLSVAPTLAIGVLSVEQLATV